MYFWSKPILENNIFKDTCDIVFCFVLLFMLFKILVFLIPMDESLGVSAASKPKYGFHQRLESKPLSGKFQPISCMVCI